MARLYEEGNYGFKVAELNDDGTYATPLTAIEGLVSVDVTFEQTVENRAADDNTSYLTLQSPLKGSGTITFINLTKDGYKALYANCVDTSGALVFGKKGKTKKLGITFFNTRVGGEEEGTSINKITFNNVVFSLPPFNSQTLKEGENNIREFAVPFTANPLTYETTDGEKDTVTYSILNSVDDVTIWEENKDKIYIPDSSAVA